MMYKDKLVAAIKTSGKILREFDKDTVYLPYGCEYSLFLKNLNSVRVLVNIQIDGQEVVPGGLVIYGGSEIDLERFVKDQNKGNRFKFIERTPGIEQHRGIGAEDGLIRVEFQVENPPVLTTTWPNWPPYTYKDGTGGWDTNNGNKIYMSNSVGSSDSGVKTKGILRSSNAVFGCASIQGAMHPGVTCGEETYTSNDAGITVPGSISDQKFVTAGWFVTHPEKHVMVFKLLGETDQNRVVRQPVTVKAKPRCQTCGKQNKASSKFCSQCGTSLEVIGQPVTA